MFALGGNTVKKTMKALIASTTVITSLTLGGAAMAQATSACLITKTDTNPFFVKMREGAAAKAAELGIELKTFAGPGRRRPRDPGPGHRDLHRRRRKGILIAASDTSSIVPAVQQARDAGILVIALDTPLEPIDAADATFATDNFRGRPPDRPVGARQSWATRRRTPASRRSTSPSASRRWTCCATRAS
jgi:fructose transport system substrate-binding protein